MVALGHIQILLELRPGLPILYCPGRPLATKQNEPTEHQRVLWKPFRMNELWETVNKALAPTL